MLLIVLRLIALILGAELLVRGASKLPLSPGISANLAPAELTVTPPKLAFDIPVMVAVACGPVFFTGNCIACWEGVLFLALYAACPLYLILYASGHDALHGCCAMMGSFVLPLVAATLLVLACGHWQAGQRGSGVG